MALIRQRSEGCGLRGPGRPQLPAPPARFGGPGVRNFSTTKRIVIKIGTNLITTENALDTEYMDTISHQIAELVENDYQVLLVSSGAIGMGATELGFATRVTDVRMRQACAAIGQPLLMHQYRESFVPHNIRIAQVLITREVLNNRKSYLNLRNSVEELLDLHVVPIFNENDSISTDEIGNAFGDNDRLSAMVASKVDADLLVILSDIEALFDDDPKGGREVHRIPVVEQVDDEILSYAGSPGSRFSTGGMLTKLKAASIAASAGCRTVLAHGRQPRILQRILVGEDIGTLFLAQEKLSARTRWILNSSPKGKIVVDEGALAALRRHKSLLPSGIKSVEGIFNEGDVVLINEVAKAVPAYNSSEIESLMGKHTRAVTELYGSARRDEIARPEDIVFVVEA
ncbi:MAG: glutamate 5-kinase [Spirochaetota bacterium]